VPSAAESAAAIADPEALRLYLLVCGMNKRATEDWQLARNMCAALYARLGGERRGAYIAVTAYSWFCLRDGADVTRRPAHQMAQEAVERHLRDPSKPLDIPENGSVVAYARGAAPQLGNPVWLRL
jgi:hypothetical protein